VKALFISRFVKEGLGAMAVEYALIAAAIAGAISAAVIGAGTEIRNTFSSVSDALDPEAVAAEAVAPVPTSAGQQHTRNRGRSGREDSDRSFDGDSFDHDHFHH
jgi:Flp pilus assembly pilin Flp